MLYINTESGFYNQQLYYLQNKSPGSNKMLITIHLQLKFQTKGQLMEDFGNKWMRSPIPTFSFTQCFAKIPFTGFKISAPDSINKCIIMIIVPNTLSSPFYVLQMGLYTLHFHLGNYLVNNDDLSNTG